jgi:hypothetical protein
MFNILQFQQVQALQTNESLNQDGLSLLTNSEVVNNRLNPIEAPTSAAHGHWFHQPGTNTQVFVIEFMPVLAAGETYLAWVQQDDNSWYLACRFSPDAKGYARTIVTGSDGSKIHKVLITRQSEQVAPGGTTVLAYPTA